MEIFCRQCGSVWNVGDSIQRAEIIEAVHFEKTGHYAIGKRKREQNGYNNNQ